MKQVYSDVIQFRGSHYDYGVYQGKLLKQSPILHNRKIQWESQKFRHFIVDINTVKQMLHHFAPGIWEELKGLADALSMKMEDAIQDFGGYYLEYGRSGCSIYTGSHYLVRNYDNDPSSYEGRYAIYQPTDHGFATIGPTMQITGRTDGMNEKGLAMGYNFINRKKSQDGFLCNMIGRIVLENCATIGDAISLLKEIPHRHSFSYCVIDRNRQSIIIEASPRSIALQKSNICTNHFEQLTDENRYRMDDSFQRYQAIQTLQADAIKPYHAFRMLNDTDKGVFSKKYGAWAGTLHTAMYFPEVRKAWFALGGDRKPLIFNLENWVQGADIHAKQLKGQLETTHAFVNMDYL
ncbi:C45 family autoproteolytic acyltransferase/hydolase [Virgibacillus salexigens]|uniref:Choloylglycine hydrolase n=2 Tax=Virgibacillus TaxID=84406 RepID=A0ABQ2DXY8_9BACI|nr:MULTISPECIES: C45 family peptidase [Virgibacillus]MYL42545.1 linear amide C-N hydrolase [Virgibacillus massiliensis]GGJ74301.1 choloylglycine hydrolase [Virgibacillus kapii]CDQ40427.1 putative choloylglycine hydrolase [Virgibacillus massiliensis]